MYFLIGISLLFAYLYAVNLVASAAATAVGSLIYRRASRWHASTRSNLIFVLRVLPLVTAIVFIFAFILPAFLLFEPSIPGETIGYKMIVVVSISTFGFAAAAYRIFASWWRTKRLIAEWMVSSEPMSIDGVSIPAYRFRHPFPVIAVVGVIRPRIFVAEQVLSELTDGELTAALEHEAGHILSRDNMKRIFMRVCGDLLVFPLGKSLDNGWLLAAESAADEYAAVRGGSRYALNLASALVKIGKITPKGEILAMPIAAYLIEPDDTSLAARVEGLLKFADTADGQIAAPRTISSVLWLIPVSILATVLLLTMNTNFLSAVHSMSEAILAGLQ